MVNLQSVLFNIHMQMVMCQSCTSPQNGCLTWGCLRWLLHRPLLVILVPMWYQDNLPDGSMCLGTPTCSPLPFFPSSAAASLPGGQEMDGKPCAPRQHLPEGISYRLSEGIEEPCDWFGPLCKGKNETRTQAYFSSISSGMSREAFLLMNFLFLCNSNQNKKNST